MKCKYSAYKNQSQSEEISNTELQMLLFKIQNQYQPKAVVRPKIKVWKDVLLLLISIAFLVLSLFIISERNIVSDVNFICLCIISGGLWLFFSIRKLLLTFITIYQKYAPSFIREACIYKPCCSEYMRISIMKYGAYKGFIKGLKRISRCKLPNGGIDEP